MSSWKGCVFVFVDSHVHSLTTNHAYSTITELALKASKRGAAAIVISDHVGPSVPRIDDVAASLANRKVWPSGIAGVRLVKGVELDVIDDPELFPLGDITFNYDRDKTVLDIAFESEVVVASLHEFGPELTASGLTDLYQRVLLSSRVNILGHPCRPPVDWDMPSVVACAAHTRIPLELNESCLSNEGARKRYRSMLEVAAEVGAHVTLGSDAHIASDVALFPQGITLLDEVRFPDNLVVSAEWNHFREFLDLKEK